MKKYEQFGDHNLDDLIHWLKQREGAELIKNDFEKLYHALYYFEEEQTESFYSKLEPITITAELEPIFKNLALLYPLSKHILLKIVHAHPLNNDNALTGKFFDIYAIDEGLTKAYSTTLCAIKDDLKRLPSRITSSEDIIASHEKALKNSQEQIKELKEKTEKENLLAQQVASLEAELAELRMKYSEDNLKAQEKRLAAEKANLEKNKKRYEELEQQIGAINKEIDRYSKDVCKKNLAELSKKSGSLPENEEI